MGYWGSGKNKFGSKRIKYDNFSFASKLEASTYLLLKSNPKIEVLQCQSQVKLSRAEITWKIDFKCLDLDTKEEFYCESKGMDTLDYLIKLKLYRTYGTKKLHIYKGTHLKPYLKEIITPEDYGK